MWSPRIIWCQSRVLFGILITRKNNNNNRTVRLFFLFNIYKGREKVWFEPIHLCYIYFSFEFLCNVGVYYSVHACGGGLYSQQSETNPIVTWIFFCLFVNLWCFKIPYWLTTKSYIIMFLTTLLSLGRKILNNWDSTQWGLETIIRHPRTLSSSKWLDSHEEEAGIVFTRISLTVWCAPAYRPWSLYLQPLLQFLI